MNRQIARLKDHYIICGGGDIGREVAGELKRARVRFVIVDKDPSSSELARDESILFVTGNAAEEEVLKEAGIERARGLISALPEDEANVFVVLTARQLKPDLTIVSQASDEKTVSKLNKVGADRVISPKQISGRRMASIMLRPSVVDFLEVVARGGDVPMRIEEARIEPGSPLINKNLRQAGIGQHTGAVIIGIVAPDGKTRVNPSSTATLSNVTLQEGDILIALGSDEQLSRLKEFARRGK